MPSEEDPQRPDWIKIYMNLVVRNQGIESAIDSWSIVVLPPSATPYLEDERSLNAAQRGPHNLTSGNLLNDREIIRRGGTKEGWLLYEGPKDRLSLAMGQTPVVEVSFKDVHDREYHVISRPGFRSRSRISGRVSSDPFPGSYHHSYRRRQRCRFWRNIHRLRVHAV